MDPERDFSYLTVAAVAGSIVLFGVVVLGEMKGPDNGKSEAVDSDGRNRRGQMEVHRQQGEPGLCPATQEAVGSPRIQPRSALSPDAGRTADAAVGNARLFAALRQVESGGDNQAIGDCGRSVGPYQVGVLARLDGGGKAADYPRMAYDRQACEAVNEQERDTGVLGQSATGDTAK